MDSSSIAAFTGFVDLLCERLGGTALLCSDDFFASMDNLVREPAAVFIADKFTQRGKWMDGWESRRKRVPGHDWCILRLGVAGRIAGVDIDTAHFLGNHAPFASIDACVAATDVSAEQLRDAQSWTEIVPQVALQLGSHNFFSAVSAGPWTHIRLNMFPDGGIARLRIFGEPEVDPSAFADQAEFDLVAAINGGRALACSDHFFGVMNNLLLPGRAENMGGGWESRRRRGPGHDWVIVRLGVPGVVDRLEIDTHHFKGNYPDRCEVQGICWPDAPVTALRDSPDWQRVLGTTFLKADDRRICEDLPACRPFTHLRLNIAPCGGVSRLRAWGQAVTLATHGSDTLLRKLNEASEDQARELLMRCCGSRRWADGMLSQRPFHSRAQLCGHAEVVWWGLGDADWLEAFSHHPRIGADVAKLREKYASTADWSSGEQAAVGQATEETLKALAEGNKAYEQRYGFIFIVCASGKSADEMLALLQSRMHRERDSELRVAAGEQVKITRLRLAKLEEAS